MSSTTITDKRIQAGIRKLRREAEQNRRQNMRVRNAVEKALFNKTEDSDGNLTDYCKNNRMTKDQLVRCLIAHTHLSRHTRPAIDDFNQLVENTSIDPLDLGMIKFDQLWKIYHILTKPQLIMLHARANNVDLDLLIPPEDRARFHRLALEENLVISPTQPPDGQW